MGKPTDLGTFASCLLSDHSHGCAASSFAPTDSGYSFQNCPLVEIATQRNPRVLPADSMIMREDTKLTFCDTSV